MIHRTLALYVALVAMGCGANTTGTPVDGGAEPDGGTVSGPSLGGPCTKAGDLACQGVGQKLQLLCDGTKWVSNGVCAGDDICDPRPGPTLGSCQKPACAAGAVACEGSTLTTCGADHLTKTKADCASPEHCKQAVGGACAKCLSMDAKCDGAVLLRCNGDRQSLVMKETCATPALCDAMAGVCKAAACATDEHRCTGDVLEKCNTGRTAFEPLKVCPAGRCDAAGRECDECTPGAAECDGATPRSCDLTGRWKTGTPCSGGTPVCKAGFCVPGACTTGEHRCSGDILEQCKSDLTSFEPVRVCSTGLCDAVGKECDECKPGAADCVGSTPRACDSSGRWKPLTACSGPTPVCKSGVCATGVCSSGEYRCSGSTLEICNSTFTGFTGVMTCGSGLCDAAGKECDECIAGTKSCDGSTPRTCNTTGHWTSLTPCTSPTPGCSGGVCVSCLSGTITKDIPFSAVTGWSPTGCCTQMNYLVANSMGAVASGTFGDAIPSGSVVKSITLSFGVEHVCVTTTNAMDFQLNGVSVGTWNSSKGPDCSCGDTRVGDAVFSAPISAYKAGTMNTISIVHNDSGACHQAITNVTGAAVGTAMRAVITYGCP